MHFSPKGPGGLALSLAALSLVALAPTTARAQTQDLFVSDQGNNTISRFAGTGPGTVATTATTTSVPGQGGTQGLAFDASGNLFAASFGDLGRSIGTITKFASTGPGTFGPGVTFATGLNGPKGLALDARGDLFVANQFGANNTGTITEFAAGTTPGTFGMPSTLLPARSRPARLSSPD